ncbi:hypothetical protein DIZ81_06935 [Legionella taurinensis]|uniref:Type IV secretion protein Dot n=1 Tax=Legionella taurinensis TaxID=70611 RepID=A0AB38N3Z1_9GAMM|nr:hypothetical protein [Legionella taurinensis]MDX1837193.1 hypothetical protein [Legionella taurinensis]PUT40332.1 hypothetical protein DB744_06935 [Legionella taurinensis]PUT41567.1 hypothetical protein DB746_09445 [Legionella taurinensis]PUT44432.1 hypothetical protein DB743_08660 [Legionella taurinensis]PUT48394.1 hypothetical protein DB745_05335 [Legionella taurinensis]
MINLSVKVNENKVIEIRIDYLRTQGIFFEENADTLNLDGINAATNGLGQLIEEVTTPSAYGFCPMNGQALAKNQIQVKMLDGTLYYSLLDKTGERIDGVLPKDRLETMFRDEHALMPSHQSELLFLKPYFPRLMNYMAVMHLGGFYFFKALPCLTGDQISRKSLPDREFLARPLSYDRKNKAKEQPYTCSSVLYEIPFDNAAAALRLIAFFEAYVKTRVHVVRGYSVEERLNGKYAALAPNQLFGDATAKAFQSPSRTLHPFVEAVLAIMNPLPHYATLFNDLQTLYRYANNWAFACDEEDRLKKRELVSELVFNEAAVKLVLKFKSPAFLYDENLPLEVRQSRFDAMIIAYEQAGLLDELLFLVEGCNRVAASELLNERDAAEGNLHEATPSAEAASQHVMTLGLHFNAQYVKEHIAKYRADMQNRPGHKNMLPERAVLSERDKQSIASLSALGLHASALKARTEEKSEPSASLPVSFEETKGCCKLL